MCRTYVLHYAEQRQFGPIRMGSSDIRFRTVLFLVSIAAAGRDLLRGGKASKRDTWYGLETLADFSDFKRWWHRRGKDEAGGKDLENRKQAEEAYDEWVQQGRPTVK